MADDVKFGLPETKLGLIPDVGGSSRLPAVVGLGIAKELLMTGRTIDAAECHRIGAANRIAAAADLERVTQELVDELLAASPLAVGFAKRVADGVAKPTLAASLEQEVAFQQILVATDDFREAGAAFMEKREPRFTGAPPGATPKVPEAETPSVAGQQRDREQREDPGQVRVAPVVRGELDGEQDRRAERRHPAVSAASARSVQTRTQAPAMHATTAAWKTTCAPPAPSTAHGESREPRSAWNEGR